jgi:acetyltransferase-like isoleucine patch superfamily enzyme
MLRRIWNKYSRYRNDTAEQDRKSRLNAQALIAESVTFGPAFELDNLTGDRNKLRIGEGCALHCQITVFEKGDFELGEYNYIGNSQFICSNSMKVGRGCFFSDRILIFDGVQHPLSAKQRVLDAYVLGMKGIRPSVYSETCIHSYVEIADAVWIGANTVVGKGVRIGTGSIIGAGSVVTRDVPDWSVAVGNPATVVKTLPVEDIEGTLQKLAQGKYEFAEL